MDCRIECVLQEPNGSGRSEYSVQHSLNTLTYSHWIGMTRPLCLAYPLLGLRRMAIAEYIVACYGLEVISDEQQKLMERPDKEIIEVRKGTSFFLPQTLMLDMFINAIVRGMSNCTLSRFGSCRRMSFWKVLSAEVVRCGRRYAGLWARMARNVCCPPPCRNETLSLLQPTDCPAMLTMAKKKDFRIQRL